jgi:hypothetical protein
VITTESGFFWIRKLEKFPSSRFTPRRSATTKPIHDPDDVLFELFLQSGNAIAPVLDPLDLLIGESLLRFTVLQEADQSVALFPC